MKPFYQQKSFIWNIVILIISFVLLFTAIDHRIQLTVDREQYVKGNLIIIEFFTICILIVMHAVNFLILIFLIYKEYWKILIFSIFVMTFSFVIIIVAFQIDTQALIYLTNWH